MAIDQDTLRQVMGHFATGVTIVTTKDKNDNPRGLTANAVTSVSLVPPLLLVCVDKKADCYPCFAESKVFAVNILAEDQEALSRKFAISGTDKFAGVGYRLGKTGVPLLEGTLGHLECRVVNAYDGGDHTIYVGEVEWAEAEGGSPLLFFRGGYCQLGRFR